MDSATRATGMVGESTVQKPPTVGTRKEDAILLDAMAIRAPLTMIAEEMTVGRMIVEETIVVETTTEHVLLKDQTTEGLTLDTHRAMIVVVVEIEDLALNIHQEMTVANIHRETIVATVEARRLHAPTMLIMLGLIPIAIRFVHRHIPPTLPVEMTVMTSPSMHQGNIAPPAQIVSS